MWQLVLVIFIVIAALWFIGSVSYKLGAGKKFYITEVVKDFCTNTKEGYVNCKPRELNTIETTEHGDGNHRQMIDALRRVRDSGIGSQLIDNILADPQHTIDIKGFYNNPVRYDDEAHDGNLESGAYIVETRISSVLKGPHEGKPDMFEGKSVVHWAKGKGRQNLNVVARKMQERGMKYFILDAAGPEELVQRTYVRYGFVPVVKGYKRELIDDMDDLFDVDNTLMIGKIDDVIKATDF